MADRALVLVSGQNREVDNATDLCIGRSIVTLGTNQDLIVAPNGSGKLSTAADIEFTSPFAQDLHMATRQPV